MIARIVQKAEDFITSYNINKLDQLDVKQNNKL